MRPHPAGPDGIGVTADTNILVRTVIRDDERQARAALTVFEAGGDFADGLIAHEGRWLGGKVFASFDRKAVALIAGQGEQAPLLA